MEGLSRHFREGIAPWWNKLDMYSFGRNSKCILILGGLKNSISWISREVVIHVHGWRSWKLHYIVPHTASPSLPRSPCPPQVAMYLVSHCKLPECLYVHTSKYEHTFLLGTLIKNTNRILGMVFLYLAFIHLTVSCKLSSINTSFPARQCTEWMTYCNALCQSTLGCTLIFNNLFILQTMQQCIILLLANV